jgi:uncharacterized membrane protein YgaE (UPF0421/DUF939 family)
MINKLIDNKKIRLISIGLFITFIVCLNFFMLNKIISSSDSKINLNKNIILNHG